MNLNLLTYQWIPVLRRNGMTSYIAPCELTDQLTSNPIIAFNSPRPDFNGALAQFLIGLLQTALPNLKAAKWRQWDISQSDAQLPTPSELKRLFSPLEPNFNLFGDGQRFMQDLELTGGESKPIAALLIEQPGQQTLEKNADHFIKRGQIDQLCPACVATALFTLQINAPSGGAGHRTSMRGGGPLTTLVISRNQENPSCLWEMLWLNVLTQTEFEIYTQLKLHDVENKNIFPWSEKTPTSENDKQVTNLDVHPFQMYWGMPRRIHLLLVEEDCQKPCSICGRMSKQVVAEYVTKNYGIKYSEHWRHVFSPYRVDKTNQFFPMHPQPGGIGYRHWLELTLEHPAAVVRANEERLQDEEYSSADREIKIYAFGYDMDNMKARCWYESYMPFYNISKGRVADVKSLVKQFVDVTNMAKLSLNIALKVCDNSIVAAGQQIWHKTEGKFYKLLKQVSSIIDSFNDAEIDKIKEDWLRHIQQQTLTIFEELADVQHAELRVMKKYVLRWGKEEEKW